MGKAKQTQTKPFKGISQIAFSGTIQWQVLDIWWAPNFSPLGKLVRVRGLACPGALRNKSPGPAGVLGDAASGNVLRSPWHQASDP